MDSSESALIREAARGDDVAFATLMRMHRERVYCAARRVVGTHENAEDIAQQVFVTMHRKLHTFRGSSKLSTWLYRVTMNACYDHVRRERPRTEMDFDRVPEPGAGPADRTASREGVAHITAHIQALPLKQRMTVTLRLCEELSFKEVARAMGCSVGAAKVNYFHGIRRLRAALDPREEPEHAV